MIIYHTIPAFFSKNIVLLPSHPLILLHTIHFIYVYNTCIIVHIFSPNIFFINWSQITFSFTYIACENEKKDKIGIPQRIKLFIAFVILPFLCHIVVLTWKRNIFNLNSMILEETCQFFYCFSKQYKKLNRYNFNCYLMSGNFLFILLMKLGVKLML